MLMGNPKLPFSNSGEKKRGAVCFKIGLHLFLTELWIWSLNLWFRKFVFPAKKLSRMWWSPSQQFQLLTWKLCEFKKCKKQTSLQYNCWQQSLNSKFCCSPGRLHKHQLNIMKSHPGDRRSSVMLRWSGSEKCSHCEPCHAMITKSIDMDCFKPLNPWSLLDGIQMRGTLGITDYKQH